MTQEARHVEPGGQESLGGGKPPRSIKGQDVLAYSPSGDVRPSTGLVPGAVDRSSVSNLAAAAEAAKARTSASSQVDSVIDATPTRTESAGGGKGLGRTAAIAAGVGLATLAAGGVAYEAGVFGSDSGSDKATVQKVDDPGQPAMIPGTEIPNPLKTPDQAPTATPKPESTPQPTEVVEPDTYPREILKTLQIGSRKVMLEKGMEQRTVFKNHLGTQAPAPSLHDIILNPDVEDKGNEAKHLDEAILTAMWINWVGQDPMGRLKVTYEEFKNGPDVSFAVVGVKKDSNGNLGKEKEELRMKKSDYDKIDIAFVNTSNPTMTGIAAGEWFGLVFLNDGRIVLEIAEGTSGGLTAPLDSNSAGYRNYGLMLPLARALVGMGRGNTLEKRKGTYLQEELDSMVSDRRKLYPHLMPGWDINDPYRSQGLFKAQ